MESEKLKELVEGLTLSGSPVLDEAKIRSVKRLCKRSEDNVKEVFKLTMTQLAKEHSEIRLSTFMIIDQIFQRSHRFRTLIVKNLNRVICSVLEVHSLNPLPPPQEAAEALRVKAIVALDEWHEKFGNAYKRIKLAYHYLSTCHKIDFVTVTAHNRSQQLMLKQREDQRKKMQREALEKTRAKVIEEKTSLNIWVRELEAGLAILMPTMTNICSNFEFDAEDFEAEAPATESEAMRQHALGSSYNLEIDLNAVNSKRVAVSDKNAELVRNMDEIAKEIEKKKFKNIKKHILSLTKNEGSQSEVVELVKLREKLESVVKKYQSLDLKRPPPKPVVESQESEDDDEFEDVKDVNEKEGFEPRIPQHLRAEYGLDTEAESSGKPVGDSAGKATPTKLKKPRQRLLAAPVAKKRKAAEEVFDPTSASATLKILKESGKLEKLKEKMKTETGEASACGSQSGSSQPSGSSSAPVVQYDRDLYYLFENPEARMPTVERNESLHRFWTPREETEHALPASLEAGLKMRKMHFTGKFVPVQHKCNVVLPSGKLCPRMDRVKCPFHGVIIVRDSKGLPLDDKLREQELEEERLKEERAAEVVKEEEKQFDEAVASTSAGALASSSAVAPWLDIDLIKDIEAQTGKDLGSKYLEKREKRGKGKGKGKGKKPESNLTNVKALNDNVRSRLEKKLFHPATCKRVNGVLNGMDKQKTYDKFGDQFNYVHGLDG